MKVAPQQAKEFIESHYDLRVVDVQPLSSERDQNFHVRACSSASPGSRPAGYVLKISSPEDSPEYLAAETEMMATVHKRLPIVPQVLASTSGAKTIELSELSNFPARHARLLTHKPGRPLARQGYRSTRSMQNLGATLAILSQSLAGFEATAMERTLNWDLARSAEVVNARIGKVDDPIKLRWISRVGNHVENEILPRANEFKTSIIHNDCNDENLLVGSTSPGAFELTGLIDFGDAVKTWTINELAIAAAYCVLDQSDPLTKLGELAVGYDAVRRLDDLEIASLFGLTGMRLATSIVMHAEQIANEPDNPHLGSSQAAIARSLPNLMEIPIGIAESHLRNVLGRSKPPRFARLEKWIEEQTEVPFVLQKSGEADREDSPCFVPISLGTESRHLKADPASNSEPEMTASIFSELAATGASFPVGVGGYLEPRPVYATSQFQQSLSAKQFTEPRTIHLGVDLFAEASTKVIVPLAGTVKLVRNIREPLDYGGLVLLEHSAADQGTFYTLYGHLDARTIHHAEGSLVQSGDVLGCLGDPNCNGGWVPHLHFQLIHDLFDLEENFPGVAKAAHQSAWATVCPNPNSILRVPEECLATPISYSETLTKRKSRLGSNLSLSYSQPLKILRGYRQYLFDHRAHRYLDAYNNVPHVGHSHPAVIDKVARQLKLLNTNTRYLHDNVLQLADAICETMPPKLEVCYFVNSASEANELAIRIARAATNARDMIVLDAAYHGHSTTLIELSPYKHNGPGGEPPSDWVHVAALPDTFRGLHRNPATAAQDYAQEVERCLAKIHRPICGFLCESSPSVAGQIMLPNGYLERVYSLVRAAGGVCIADEVQTGYGRLGEAFYSFELQGVTPDIVILGKPIGNGFPLAAVVVTRQLADAFDNGMEFFSTFGGNPVACAAGVAVLETLANESLQENAKRVGAEIVKGLRQLQGDVEAIGDIRGLGFFLGAELVKDRDQKIPDAELARFIVNFMSEQHVLMGTDGPDHNVLKIRPPMCFDMTNAMQFMEKLQMAFQAASTS